MAEMAEAWGTRATRATRSLECPGPKGLQGVPGLQVSLTCSGLQDQVTLRRKNCGGVLRNATSGLNSFLQPAGVDISDFTRRDLPTDLSSQRPYSTKGNPAAALSMARHFLGECHPPCSGSMHTRKRAQLGVFFHTGRDGRRRVRFRGFFGGHVSLLGTYSGMF